MNEYDPSNEGIKIKEEKNGDILIKGPRGESRIKFEGENISKVIITHRFKNEIDIYIKEENDNILYIIDESAVIENEIKNKLSEKEIQNIISKYGIIYQNKEFQIKTTVKNIIKDFEKMIKASIEVEGK